MYNWVELSTGTFHRMIATFLGLKRERTTTDRNVQASWYHAKEDTQPPFSSSYQSSFFAEERMKSVLFCVVWTSLDVSDRVIKWPAKLTDRIEVNLFPFCVRRAIWVILTSMAMFQSQAWRGGRASSARWLHVWNIVRGGQQIQKRPRHTGRR